MKPTFNIENLIRPNIRKMKPYRSARDDYEQGLLLDANENSLGAPWSEADGLHRYPSPYQRPLREKLAELRGVEPENVFAGVGSDEGIDLLYRIFCEPQKDKVLITPPTYGMYKVSAGIHDVGIKEVLLDENFQPQVDEVLDSADEHTKILFLCSPNNPTGNLLTEAKVKRLVESFPGIVVVDEAYIDFSDSESWAKQVTTHPNLVVLQTMSKSFGLAGIRMGIAFASKSIINFMMKVKAPYNINALTGKYALEAFNHLESIRFKIDKIKEERTRLRSGLDKLPVVQKIYPSDANFLLIKIDKALEIYKKLADREVIVRYRGNEPLCENCLRITVGTRDENQTLLKTLKEITS